MRNTKTVYMRIYESEVQALALEASKYTNRETGGDIYGLWSHGNTPVIFLVTGPGPKSGATQVDFQQDHEFVMHCHNELSANFGIQYLGDWHSHHVLNLHHPSNGDLNRAYEFAAKQGWQQLTEIIVTHPIQRPNPSRKGGEDYVPEFELVNGFIYFDAIGRRQPERVQLKLLPGESPIRRTLLAGSVQSILDRKLDWRKFPLDRIRFDPVSNAGGIWALFSKRQTSDSEPPGCLPWAHKTKLEKESEKIQALMGDLPIDKVVLEEIKGGVMVCVSGGRVPTFVFAVQLGHPQPKLYDVFVVNQSNQLDSIKERINLAAHNSHPNSIQRVIEELASSSETRQHSRFGDS